MTTSERQFHPQTTAVQGFYKPELSEGSAKPPQFNTSTFIAPTAEALAHYFKQAYGLGMPSCPPSGLVYSRLVNPNCEIYEHRCAAFENAEAAALFGSGMAAIFSTFMSLLEPGDRVIFGGPVYGGTDLLLRSILTKWGVNVYDFNSLAMTDGSVAAMIERCKPKMIFLESPANPTLTLADIKGIAEVAHQVNPETIVFADNTVLTFAGQRVLDLGADLTILSATKMLGGHDDLIAGLVMGRADLVQMIKDHRTIFGTGCDPATASLLLRSLEDLLDRASKAEKQAVKVAQFLNSHPAVAQIHYPGFEQGQEQMRRFSEQCTGRGGFMSFRIEGDLKRAYAVIDAFQVFKISVSLGGTLSLTSHPMTHTHADVAPKIQQQLGITEDLIRISVGNEHVDDILWDLEQALDKAMA
jgi:methionine-gamma-lyase